MSDHKAIKRVVLTEHSWKDKDGSEHKVAAFIYQYPCGTLSYSKNRKHHNWYVIRQGIRYDFGEDYRRACEACAGDITARILVELR